MPPSLEVRADSPDEVMRKADGGYRRLWCDVTDAEAEGLGWAEVRATGPVGGITRGCVVAPVEFVLALAIWLGRRFHAGGGLAGSEVAGPPLLLDELERSRARVVS